MSRLAGGRPSRTFTMPSLGVAVLLACAAAPAARATPARLFALGGGDHLTDTSDLFRWPGAARDDAGGWWVDSGRLFAPDAWGARDDSQDTGPAAAVAWNPGGDEGAWTAGLGAWAFAADADQSGLHRDGPGRSLAALLGRRAGNIDVAASWRVSFGDVPGAVGPAETYRHRRDVVGLGARLDVSPRAFLDLACDAQRERNLAIGGLDALDPRGDEVLAAKGWSARARAFIALDDHLTLAPVAEVVEETRDGARAADQWWLPVPTGHTDERLVRLGAGLCRLSGPDRLLALSFEHLSVRGNNLGHLRLAMEQRVNWWLSLRASTGVVRTAGQGNFGVDDYEPDLAGGAALHLGPWSLDVSAGTSRPPEPRRWLAVTGRTDSCLRATLQRTF